jgi:protein phosphatase
MIRATSGVTTHVGQVRDGNEDNFVSIDGLYFVADGMGGHSAGEVASEIAVRILQEVYTDPKVRVSSPGLLADAISTANTAIFMEAMHDSSKTGMGTTLTGLAVTNGPDNQIVVANVGDSRTYLWRHGELRQITKDHSHVQTPEYILPQSHPDKQWIHKSRYRLFLILFQQFHSTYKAELNQGDYFYQPVLEP